MFDEIHEKNIGNVAVDLTDNGGGSSSVAPDIECNPYEAVDVIKEITRK